jgi:hypothetical protein
VKVLAAVDRGIPRRREVADLGKSLICSESPYLPSSAGSTEGARQERRQHPQDPRQAKITGRPSVKGKALRQWLPSQLKSNPDLTLAEHIARLSSMRAAWRSPRLR